jgi:hypothetical protein
MVLLIFTQEFLGFDSKSVSPSWACVEVDNVELMFSLPNEHIPFDKPIFSGSFYFKTTSIDEIWENVKDKTGVCYPIEDFEYGMREFGIYDNNGYLLQFSQAL